MSDAFGPTFITVTDEDDNELVLELIASLEHEGHEYRAFFPAEVEGEEENEEDGGLIILKIIEENGEELLSTCDSEEEIETIFNLFVELLDEEDEE